MNIATAKGFALNAGYFLVSPEKCTRITGQVDDSNEQVVEEGAEKFIPAGAVFPANDGTAKGIVYEAVDVTNGPAACSVVIAGVVYENKMPEISEEAKSVLKESGIVFIEEDDVIRPY